MELNTKEPIEFTGWVEHISEPTKYEHRFTVANYKTDSEKEEMRLAKQMPLCFEFNASMNNDAHTYLDLVEVGDKVKVRFYPYGKSGISKMKGTYYCINSFNIAKKDGIEVLQKVVRANPESSEPEQVEDIDTSDIPF